MKYQDFRNALKYKAVFNTNEIKKIDPSFHRRQLVSWQNDGYIIKIRNGYYSFAEQDQNESFFFHLSNQIYKPSYISLESALSYYNLIPEAAFTITSITTSKTITFQSDYGNYYYRKIKPNLFFGYNTNLFNNYRIKIADPEKMILDYLYFYKPKDIAQFEALRMNKEALQKLINYNKLESYLTLYKSLIMNTRYKIFKQYIND